MIFGYLEELLSRPVLLGLSTWTLVIWAGRLLALAHIPQVLIQRRDRPMSALAWILCLLQLPYLGVLCWWVYGLTHLRRRRRKRASAHKAMRAPLTDLRAQLGQDLEGAAFTADVSQIGRAQLMLVSSEHGAFPATRDNSVTALLSGDEAYDAFERAVRAATHHIHFEFYIWRSDATGIRFRDLLIERARAGVQVRALYDGIGGSEVVGSFMQPLIDAGGQVATFLPVSIFERRLRVNFRNHRKIIVVDGRVGFTGGVNLADEYREWEDTAVRLEGPVVYQLQEVFAEDWYFATNENLATASYFPNMPGPEHGGTPPGDAVARVIASGPDLRRQIMHQVFFMAITLARTRIWLVTPYFIPEQSIIAALTTAALRGLDVQIIVPGDGASDVSLARWAGQAFYEELLEAGVKIHEYHGKILHAKVLLIDEQWSFVGSANLDIRSFRLNFEVNCLLSDAASHEQFAAWFARCRDLSQPLLLPPFAQRGRAAKVLEGAARLFSPLL
jgi:cardiolipin synthase A/B